MAKIETGANGDANYDMDVVKNGQQRIAMVNGSTGQPDGRTRA